MVTHRAARTMAAFDTLPDDVDVQAANAPRAPLAESRGAIWAVVVAFNRDTELVRLLTRLGGQTVKLSGIVLVDNANLPSTAAIAARFGAEYIGSAANLGGAGGFSLGMLTALARGASALWLWDDDGFPADEHCLAQLGLLARTRGADVVSPLIVADDDPAHTAFTFYMDGRRTYERALLQRQPVIEGFAHLFNGALIQSASLGRVGLPDFRLFIRGDEVDFLYRIVRTGGVLLTCTAAVAYHPSGRSDISIIPLLSFGVMCPAKPERRALAFRNRAYVFRRHHRWLYLLTDPLRYGAFFLLRRRPDWAGYRAWLAATLRGLREQFGEPPPPREPERPASRAASREAPAADPAHSTALNLRG
jgi:rhamnopyranosyl-N-acetylglucosaminyl-diphospho-decaprenol beta-1,3/1,4-galactofuranosyltransferase